MMRWIVGTSLKARRAVVAIAVVIMVFGVWTLSRAETDVLPEFAPVTVDVQTEALGLSARLRVQTPNTMITTAMATTARRSNASLAGTSLRVVGGVVRHEHPVCVLTCGPSPCGGHGRELGRAATRCLVG